MPAPAQPLLPVSLQGSSGIQHVKRQSSFLSLFLPSCQQARHAQRLGEPAGAVHGPSPACNLGGSLSDQRQDLHCMSAPRRPWPAARGAGGHIGHRSCCSSFSGAAGGEPHFHSPVVAAQDKADAARAKCVYRKQVGNVACLECTPVAWAPNQGLPQVAKRQPSGPE
jgi:hypothetical protein